MSPLLEKAIEEIRKLPDAEQESFAALILAELESEQRWNSLFDKSQDLLSKLASDALKEHQAGQNY
jgi:hypothetical protein